MTEERREFTQEYADEHTIPLPHGGTREYLKHDSHRAHVKDGLEREPKDFFEHELVFIESYCANLSLPDTQRLRKAANEAGYKNVNSGYRLLRQPHIARAIYDRLRFEKLAAPELVEKLGRIIRGDIKQFIRLVPRYREVEKLDEETGEVKTVKEKTHDEPVVDIVRAMEEDDTYSIKSIEFYRTGEVKRIALEDRLEAMKMLGSVYGLFGNKQLGDDENRPWWERAREKGYDPKQVIEEMLSIAKSMGQEIPKELIEGQVKETVTSDGGVELEFPSSRPEEEEEE